KDAMEMPSTSIDSLVNRLHVTGDDQRSTSLIFSHLQPTPPWARLRSENIKRRHQPLGEITLACAIAGVSFGSCIPPATQCPKMPGLANILTRRSGRRC